MQTALTRQPSPSLAGFAATLPGKLTIGLAATAIIAASAHIAFPLPFTPVPFILTPLAVLGAGLAFGPIGGFLVLLAYLAEGACGLPVFSPTGPGGLAQLLGPTAGYLWSYPIVAAIAGGLTRALEPRVTRMLAAIIACTVAVAVLFLCGAGWLSLFAHLSLHRAWIGAVAPFLPGEAIKIVCAAGIYTTLYRTRKA